MYMDKQKEALLMLNITVSALVETIMSKAVILSKDDFDYFTKQTDKIQKLLQP